MSIKAINLENNFEGDSSYLASFDPYVQLALGLSEDFIKRRLIIQSLMNDKVFTSLSHILGSTLSFNIIAENKHLLEDRVVIPYTREYHSVSGIIKDKLSRYEYDCELYCKWCLPISKTSYMQQIFNEVPNPNVSDINMIADQKEVFLVSNLKCVISHPPMQGMTTFTDGLIRDLQLFRKSSDKDVVKDLSSRLIEFIDEAVTDRMNRNLYFSIIDNYKLPRKIKRRLLELMIFNYYVGYLSNLKWYPTLDPPDFSMKSEGQFGDQFYPGDKAVIFGRTSAKAFEEFVQESLIPVHVIDSLRDYDIIELRNNRYIKSFRCQVKQLISELFAQSTEASQVALFLQTKRIAKEVVKIIQERAQSQTQSITHIRRFRNVLYTISLFAAGTLLHPALLALLLPPVLDTLTEGGLTRRILCHTHKFDLVLLREHLQRRYIPGIGI